jgi:hypothetical protein
MMDIFADTIESDPGRYEWVFGKAPCPYPVTDPEAAHGAGEAPAGSEEEAAPTEAQGAAPDEAGDEAREPEHTAEADASALAEHPLDGAR